MARFSEYLARSNQEFIPSRSCTLSSSNAAPPKFVGTASTTTNLGGNAGEAIGGFVSSIGKYEPILVHSNNATAQGYIERVAAIYTNRGGPGSANAFN